jgi:hypothetical protein
MLVSTQHVQQASPTVQVSDGSGSHKASPLRVWRSVPFKTGLWDNLSIEWTAWCRIPQHKALPSQDRDVLRSAKGHAAYRRWESVLKNRRLHIETKYASLTVHQTVYLLP